MRGMNRAVLSLLALACAGSVSARELQPKPAESALARYEGWLAPAPKGLVLKKGDRLAIVGDSITEQKMYSRIMETYLAVCRPDLQVACRQYGWSGEQASGFLNRMKNDCLRFQPTVATTCYGMNDHRYVPYEDEIGATYRQNQTAVVKTFKEAGVRVVLGSPGTIATVPGWVKSAKGTWEDLNNSLCRLRNIDIEIAEAEGVGFADVYWPMLTAAVEAKKKFGDGYHLSGGDGVHPGWAGQVIMASAFLSGLGLDGDIGTLTVDLAAGKGEGSEGHTVTGFTNGELHVTSTRIPFCAEPGDLASDNSVRSGMALAGFWEKLNRFVLKVKNAPAGGAKVTWGAEGKDFTKDQLEKGVNLAEHFAVNPCSALFDKVSAAVEAKQKYETRQIKEIFHGPEGSADPEGAAAVTEKVHVKLVAALAKALKFPVEHVIKIEAK